MEAVKRGFVGGHTAHECLQGHGTVGFVQWSNIKTWLAGLNGPVLLCFENAERVLSASSAQVRSGKGGTMRF